MAKFEKGQTVKAKVLDVDVEKERISLGIKQLQADPAAEVLDSVRKGDIVTCIVTAGAGERHRGEGRGRADRLHPPRRARP